MRILQYPDPALKQAADSVDADDKHLSKLVERMTRTMLKAPGVGLAATQVGVQKRVIVFQREEETGVEVLLNPQIVEFGEETCLEEEGCLSFPGIVVDIERPTSVVCTGMDMAGEPLDIEADGLLARILQHEIDHLDGVLIVDRAEPEERIAALRRYREANE